MQERPRAKNETERVAFSITKAVGNTSSEVFDYLKHLNPLHRNRGAPVKPKKRKS